jgi:hypothetical protein
MSGPADKRVSTGQRETAKKLVHDRITAELAAVPTGASDPDKEKALASGFQFRLYYNASGFYAGAAGEIETFLKGLFGEAGSPPAGQATLAAQIAALPTAARAALRLRYQTIPVAQSATPNRTGGKIETLGHDNMVGSGALQDALTKMPFGKAPASTSAPPPMPTPTPPPKSTSLDGDLLDDENVLAMAP